MARLEIPSIVVHNGSNSAPGSPTMERNETLVSKTSIVVKEKVQSNGVIAKSDEVRKDRVRPLSKMKLLQRSHAMREETSPPPDPESHDPSISPPQLTNNNSLSVRPSSRHKLSRQGSSRDSTDSASPCLSRENSTEQYTDFTGTDLEHFISETINKNYKDRALMLQIESQLVSYIRERPQLRQYYKFPAMSSYQRMLVHRVAAHFGMEHNVDQPGNCVVVNRTKGTRIPEVEFKDYIKEDLLFPEEPRRSILKRDSSSFEDSSFKSPERHYSSECRRSKSFEEREEEYEKARKRIFTKSCDEGNNVRSSFRRSSPDDIRWPGDIQPWSSNSNNRSSRLLKVESFEGGDTLKAGSLRLSVSKSYSFGGYSVGGMTTSSTVSVLTKQDSGSSMSSRISPSSSGYKSQSQRSDATMSATPSPTATPHSSQLSPHPDSNAVLWAVTDMSAVPPGSLLINPQTGQPFTNPDGSVYRYDPANPLKSKVEESKNVSTQITPVPSLPPSPAKTMVSPTIKNTTTTSTSPSFPVTPPPSISPQHSYKQQPMPFAMQPQQVDSSVLYANPPIQCHNQVQPNPMVYTGYHGMGPPYDQRTGDACSMSMTDLSSYFMGMCSDQHRGGGDTNNQPPQPNNSQPPNNYWQPPQAGMPMYYTIPPSPPQPPAQNPRYITYPSYQQPESRQAHNQNNGNYMAPPGAYQVPTYGPPQMMGNGSNECGLMYAPPSQQAPPTPQHSQPVSYVFLNGGPSYPPVYNNGPTSGPGPTPSQYMPVMPSPIGLFRPSMQMMHSSPPPRPPRDNSSGSKPPSVTSNKERHYDNSTAEKMIRYQSMPGMYHMMPGGTIVGNTLRLPFPLPPHHPNHRGPPQHYAQDNRARKPRPKGLPMNQPRQSLHHPSGYGGNNDAGRMGNHGNGLPSKHH